jgi:long-chain acyl-CoA synthetase
MTTEEVDWRAAERDPERRPARPSVPWAAQNDVDLPGDRTAVCRDEHVRAWVAGHIENVSQAPEPHERIKRFELVSTEWTPENDPFTPSLKKKRRNILDRFDAEVGRIYAAGRLADD